PRFGCPPYGPPPGPDRPPRRARRTGGPDPRRPDHAEHALGPRGRVHRALPRRCRRSPLADPPPVVPLPPTLRRRTPRPPPTLLRSTLDRPRGGLLVQAGRGVRDPGGGRPRRRRHPH